MSYFNANLNKKNETIDVVCRENGVRVFRSYPINYDFYYEDPNGKYKTIYHTPVSKVSPKNSKEFYKEIAQHSNKKLFESDLNLTFKCLSEHYLNTPSPELHVCMLDIETAFDPVRGYSSPEEAFNEITSISLKFMWTNQLFTLAVPPKTITFAEAKNIASKFENTFIFENESELLDTFLDLIVQAEPDLISDWNGEYFDLPVIVNRIIKVLGKEATKKLCLWNEYPKVKTIESYGKEVQSYDLIGIVHIDMLSLYRRFTYEERESYSLNSISMFELGKGKTEYEGSLHSLYNNDFELFLTYGKQDVQLLSDLDDKLKLIDLLCEVAHVTTTLLPTAMGTVASFDQSVINRSHFLGLVVPDKKKHDKSKKYEETNGIAGAHVSTPKSGIKEFIGIIDVSSLYPNSLKLLSCGVENIIFSLRPTYTDARIKEKMLEGKTFAECWQNQFGSLEYQYVMEQRDDIDIIIDWENGNSETKTAHECHDYIFNGGQKWILSGNGTVFTYARPAIISGLFEGWATTRKKYQKKKSEYEELYAALDQKNDSANKDELSELKMKIKYYNRLQMVQKLLQNSGYGALVADASRFSDKRVGQSITLTGKICCKHMNSFVNECITGKYEIEGDAIIAIDTDSSQFSAYEILKPMIDSGEIEWNRQIAVDLYLSIADKVNASFPDFLAKAFNCPPEFRNYIKGNCESVGSRGLYITKKRYAILNYYKDGVFYSEGHEKKKIMGLDLRRSDCPKIVQQFLERILTQLLEGKSEDTLIDQINEFKIIFKDLKSWEKGTPKRVNGITGYVEKLKHEKVTTPGHVSAGINWNKLRVINHDNVSSEITDGMKTIVCPLRPNYLGMTNVAYPIDEHNLPQWFKDLPFDDDKMMQTVVEKKIENLLGSLPMWENVINSTKKVNTFSDIFDADNQIEKVLPKKAKKPTHENNTFSDFFSVDK